MAAETKKKSEKISPRTFDSKQREEIMKKWHALREKGENAQDAAKKVGVSYLSLHKWEARFGKGAKAEKVAKEEPTVVSLQEHRAKKATTVEVAPSGCIMVTTPNGFKVELPDIAAVKQLIS
jgi:hypothetical protein